MSSSANLKLEMNPAGIVDVVIVGGGPAGLSAALLLGRCGRTVVVVDADKKPMDAEPASGAFAGFNGLPPYEAVEAGWGQLRKLKTVTHLQAAIDDVERSRFGFTVHCGDGTTIISRAVLLASDDIVPTPYITGAEQFYESSLHECPYCDGWEHRGRRIGVLGADEAAVDLALKLLQWSSRVTLFSNGAEVVASCVKRLERARVQVVSGTVTALEGQARNLEILRIGEFSSHPCEALFFPSARKYHRTLAARLGCDVERMSGAVYWQPDGEMVIEGLFVAGKDLKKSEIAALTAGEGLTAAKSANDWLLEADHSYLAVKTAPPVRRTFRQTLAPRRMAI